MAMTDPGQAMKQGEPPAKRRLRAFTVKGLFGQFDHRIELKQDRITIVHGPNGYGKTTLLRLLFGFFESRFSMLRAVPFGSITFTLDDGTEVEVVEEKVRLKRSEPSPRMLHVRMEGEKEYGLKYRRFKEFPEKRLDGMLPWLRRIDSDLWYDVETGEKLDTEEVIDRYAELLPKLQEAGDVPDWLRQIQDSVDVYFIQAHRLESPVSSGRDWRRRRGEEFRTAPAVAAYAEQLAERIRRVQSEYTERSQSLDKTFPLRFMSAGKESPLSQADVEERLAELDRKRQILMSAGLLEHEDDSTLVSLREADESERRMLKLYIDDAQKRLAVFDDLRQRIELLTEILNARFLFKQVRVDKARGLVFETDSGQELSPTSLSTGEQHEVVMLYQLLFLTTPGSLVLIDEPEISLHVSWQNSFLKDLARIAELSQIDFLIATHSPQIISNRWDLTVELKGPAA